MTVVVIYRVKTTIAEIGRMVVVVAILLGLVVVGLLGVVVAYDSS